jgi:hypothetical protein
MSGDTKFEVKTEKSLLEKFVPQPFFKLITVVLTKVKNMWSMQDTLSGIRIYADMED